MSEKRFVIDYSPDVDCISLFDNEEQSVFILEWYLKEFKKFRV